MDDKFTIFDFSKPKSTNALNSNTELNQPVPADDSSSAEAKKLLKETGEASQISIHKDVMEGREDEVGQEGLGSKSAGLPEKPAVQEAGAGSANQD